MPLTFAWELIKKKMVRREGDGEGSIPLDAEHSAVSEVDRNVTGLQLPGSDSQGWCKGRSGM